MAAALRAVVGRVTATLGQAFSTTARSIVPQSQRSFSSSHPVASSFALTSRTSWSPVSFVPSPLLTSMSRNLLADHMLNPVMLAQSRCYHVRVALKRRCSGCFFVRRKGRLYVDCKLKPRHKQMQVMSKRKTWREDYSKGNIERALYWKFNSEKRYYKLGDNQFSRHNWLEGKIGVTV